MALSKVAEASTAEKEELSNLRRQKKLLVHEVVTLRSQIQAHETSIAEFTEQCNSLAAFKKDYTKHTEELVLQIESIRNVLENSRCDDIKSVDLNGQLNSIDRSNRAIEGIMPNIRKLASREIENPNSDSCDQVRILVGESLLYGANLQLKLNDVSKQLIQLRCDESPKASRSQQGGDSEFLKKIKSLKF